MRASLLTKVLVKALRLGPLRRLQVGAREGFGSFHSDDIEKLIGLSSEKYEAPEVHWEVTSKTLPQSMLATIGQMKFGEEIRSALFTLDPSFVFLNHGAFGAAMRPLQLEAEAWRRRLESQPLRFYDRQLLPLVVHSIRHVASYLGCSAKELLPLTNVTTGLNAVFSSLEPFLGPGDVVACTSLTYGSTKKMLAVLAGRTGCSLLVLPISLPISARADSMVANVVDGVGGCTSRLRLLVIDSVTSNTAIKMPVGRIARAVRKRQSSWRSDLIIVADAAHSLQLDGDIRFPTTRTKTPSCTGTQDTDTYTNPDDESSLEGIDAWITNGHKWACMPKGVAFMWTSPRLSAILRPCVVSHGFSIPVPVASFYPTRGADARLGDGGRLLSGFAWDGCRDYAAFLTVPSALAIWNVLTGAREYNARLLMAGKWLSLDHSSSFSH